jgi:hypothetical protein
VRLWLEVEGVPGRRELPGGGADLVAFLSFAVSRGFGATHPLIALADRLHDEHGVRFGPLTTFYDAEAEDPEDLEKLEMAWQGAGTLAEELRKVAAALASDQMCANFARRGGSEEIGTQAKALAGMLNGVPGRVRMVYAL